MFSKLGYALRCQGDIFERDVLERFDDDLRSAVECILGGDLPDHAWVQATLGVQAAGLGLRESSSVALPAFVASRIVARPLVLHMASHMEAADLATVDAIAGLYDERTNAATATLLGLSAGACTQAH